MATSHSPRLRVARDLAPEPQPLRWGSLTAVYVAGSLIFCVAAGLLLLVLLPRWRSAPATEPIARAADRRNSSRIGAALYADGGHPSFRGAYRGAARLPDDRGSRAPARRIGPSPRGEGERNLLGSAVPVPPELERHPRAPRADTSDLAPPSPRAGPEQDERPEAPAEEEAADQETTAELVGQAEDLEQRARQVRLEGEAMASELEDRAEAAHRAAEAAYTARRGTLGRIEMARRDLVQTKERARQMREQAHDAEEKLLAEAHRIREHAETLSSADTAAPRR